MARYLHTSIFVNDMAQSIDFYTKKLGLKLLDGPVHYPGNADMAFVGDSWDAYIELVYDLEDHPPYEVGNRYEHLALEVPDVPAIDRASAWRRRAHHQRAKEIAEWNAHDCIR